MYENFGRAFDFAMLFEGYKSEDPDDPGGRTIFGISARSWPGKVADLWDLPRSEALTEAKIFYLTRYWQPGGCDSLPFPVDIYFFDAAVNMGVKQARDLYVRATSPFDFLMLRIEFYVSIATGNKSKFLRGWVRRVAELYRSIERG